MWAWVSQVREWASEAGVEVGVNVRGEEWVSGAGTSVTDVGASVRGRREPHRWVMMSQLWVWMSQVWEWVSEASLSTTGGQEWHRWA